MTNFQVSELLFNIFLLGFERKIIGRLTSILMIKHLRQLQFDKRAMVVGSLNYPESQQTDHWPSSSRRVLS